MRDSTPSFFVSASFQFRSLPHPPSVTVPPHPLGEVFQRIDFIYQFYIFAPDSGSS